MPLLLVVLPFAAACLGLALGGRRPALVAPLAIGGTAAALGVAVLQAVAVVGPARPIEATLATFVTGGPPISVGAYVDPPAATVAVMVTVVALLVQVYSTAYLRHHGVRYSSYAALVSLFTAAMLLVVVAADLLVLLVGWEVMGICSYFLVGHEWERAEARAAAVKAFLVTRLGDVGFLFGIFVLGSAAGSFRIPDVLAAVPRMPPGTVLAGTLLLLCGLAGKSAQFPLHVWLPDAMAGPTPVSALIHAATMVAAGIYVVARLHPAFLAAPATLAVLGVLAAVTMLGAALAALAEDDLKRVLAWSTVSQLAYLAGALAVGGRAPALFHLLSHAAFKALLFLAAGAVIAAAGTGALAALGGLRRPMPVTFATMTLGLAALAGVPPLSGFVSKESLLGAAEEVALHAGPVASWVGWLVLVTGLLTVAVTAAYATRLWLLTFLGPRRGEAAGAEAPPPMRWPLVVLAVPTVALGLLGLPANLLPAWLAVPAAPLPEDPLRPGELGSDEPVAGSLERATDVPAGFVPGLGTAIPSVLLLCLGVLAGYALWRRDPVRAALPPPVAAVAHTADALDSAYAALVVRPVAVLARLADSADRDVVHPYVRGFGAGARLLGGALRYSQAGNVQAYLTALLAGVVVLAVGAAVLA
ncbi:MAG: NADH-quinone oxidoreductase subunit L [Actinomycetota bacterium]|nr:NADH-quinone oxidoreductase subunit L [Actinomycetota bacterium]